MINSPQGRKVVYGLHCGVAPDVGHESRKHGLKTCGILLQRGDRQDRLSSEIWDGTVLLWGEVWVEEVSRPEASTGAPAKKCG